MRGAWKTNDLWRHKGIMLQHKDRIWGFRLMSSGTCHRVSLYFFIWKWSWMTRKMDISGPTAYMHGPQSGKHPRGRCLAPHLCINVTYSHCTSLWTKASAERLNSYHKSNHCRVTKWWREAGWRQGLSRGTGGDQYRRSVGDSVWRRLGHKGSHSGVSTPELPQRQSSCWSRSLRARYTVCVGISCFCCVCVFFM